MNPARLRELLKLIRINQRAAAKLLGYSSHNSLQQCLTGRATLPDAKAEWLETYARFRVSQLAAQQAENAAWLQQNSPPP